MKNSKLKLFKMNNNIRKLNCDLLEFNQKIKFPLLIFMNNQPNKRIKWSKVNDMMNPIYNILETAHQNNIFHMNICPQEIFIIDENTATISFFDDTYYRDGKKGILVRQGYSPIEFYSSKGKIGPWSDIYSLGATIYTMLSGCTPSDVMERTFNDDIKTLSSMNISIPQNVDNAILKSLNLEIHKRFKTIKQFRTALIQCN